MFFRWLVYVSLGFFLFVLEELNFLGGILLFPFIFLGRLGFFGRYSEFFVRLFIHVSFDFLVELNFLGGI